MKPRICLVGQVVVDVLHLRNGINPRLGGVFHAAKTLSALACDFDIGYIAPKYLDGEIQSHAGKLSARKVIKLGEIDGCPNVLLVGEPTEAGSQNYEFLLNEHSVCKMYCEKFADYIRENAPTDVIIFPGGFNLKQVLLALRNCNARIHIDANFEPTNFGQFKALGRPLQSLILSTSSDTFLNTFKANCQSVCNAALKVAHSFLLKENRGGSRYFTRTRKAAISVPAFPRKIIHSVGVGDCFNSVLVYLLNQMPPKAALYYSSLIAAEYASTLDQALFKRAAIRTMKIISSEVVTLKGINLPWELRPAIQIYIAAPDFKCANRSHIETIVACLKYHNFTPRRPVMENGEVTGNTSPIERTKIAASDIRLLDECQILLAVPIFDDPGTYIEMGYGIKKQRPVIVFRPNRITDNLLIDELPTLVSSNLDEVITEIFIQAAKLYAK